MAAIVGALALALYVRVRARDRALARLRAAQVRFGDADVSRPLAGIGPLRRWLHRAGLRQPGAATAFVTATAAGVVAGALLIAAMNRLHVLPTVRTWALDAPRVLAALAVPLVAVAPWLLGCLLGLLPTMWVRGRRRARVVAIESDLPAVLELLAAMARAGLGFAAGLARLIDSQPADRPLLHELALLQRDSLAGIPRAEALLRLADRVDVPTLSTFCSALIHAESAGIGLSEILRQQADDLRGRRREATLLAAQSLPVKLVFPLVICFLPALFLFTLGPAFASFLGLADTIIGGAR